MILYQQFSNSSNLLCKFKEKKNTYKGDGKAHLSEKEK